MTQGNDPSVHMIRDGRFVCTAPPTAPCRNYPACGCEEWSEELHGDQPAPGHENVPQDECWVDPWIAAGTLADSYGTETVLDDRDFPDGAVVIEWGGDFVTWEYADSTVDPEIGRT